MSKFGWSYPPGVTGSEPEIAGGDDRCFVCGRDVDSCDCAECPKCHAVGEPSCFAECGLPPREDSVAAFLAHIGIEPLSAALRAIDKHNVEHVWLILADERTLYHYTDGLDDVPTWMRVERVGVGCIAWDGSDWEFGIEVSPAPWANLDAARKDAHEALAEHRALAEDEA
jgi:hypothetical protein